MLIGKLPYAKVGIRPLQTSAILTNLWEIGPRCNPERARQFDVQLTTSALGKFDSTPRFSLRTTIQIAIEKCRQRALDVRKQLLI